MGRVLICIVTFLWVFGVCDVAGFVALQPSSRRNLMFAARRQQHDSHQHRRNHAPTVSRHIKSSSALSMGYLPPGGGNRGGGIDQILGSVATLALTVAFFMSPLGGLFFAVFNSFIAFIFLAPTIVIVGFQAWQFFNTVQGGCPSCGAPLRVMKDQNQPSICLNCGAFVVADGSGGIGFAGGGGASSGAASNDDVITGNQEEEESNIFNDFFDNSWGAKRAPSKPPPGARKDLDIIDAEIEDEDRPFM